jgi:uncharacterized membrane protein
MTTYQEPVTEVTEVSFPKSHTTLNGHPIHPMLIPLPITTLAGALITDLVFIFTQDSFWARMSFWLLGAGVVTGIAAAVVGLIDFWSNSRIRALGSAWVHMLVNAAALLIAIVNLVSRTNAPNDRVSTLGVLLSAASALVLVVGGWFGGELVFRHRVAVQPTDEADTIGERSVVP